jgi:hypothetical protein
MASIYESPGQQVALTGSQTSPSFQPVQAYDPSRMMLRQSEQDLQAFAQFSESLTSFLTNQAKAKNEAEYNLGLADILNGDTTLTDQQSDQYQARVTVLKNAAEVDSEVASDLTNEGKLATAQQFKKESKAISGWRAYGRAVGQVKNTASNSQAFMLNWMKSKEPVIPTPDRGLISPSEVVSPDEIQAALEMGQQQLIAQSNIRGINPVIIAEHLAPTLQNVKGQLFANKLATETRKQEETAVSDTIANTRSEFQNTSMTVEGMSESFQRNVSNLTVNGNMGRGPASDNLVKEILGTITTLPELEAKAQLSKLDQVRKIANDPNSITLGSAYAQEFDKALDIIEGKVQENIVRLERDRDRQADQAYNILLKAQQDATLPPDQLKSLRQETIGILGQLSDQGSSSATRMRAEILSEPLNVDYTLYRQYREGIAQGKRPTDTQIDADVTAGRLSTEMGRELKVFATSSDDGDFKKQFGPSIEDAVKAKLADAGAVSLNPFNKPDKHVLHVQQMTNDLVQQVSKWRKAQQAKGIEPTDNDINQFVLNQLPETTSRYFQQNPNTKEWTPRKISNNPELAPDRINSALRGNIPDAAGFNPRTIRLRNYNSGSTRQLTKSEVEDSILKLQQGQPVPRRVQELANSANGGIIGLLTDQAQHNRMDTAPILALPEAQRQAQNRAVAPWATQRLNASNGNYFQQMLQLRRIVEAQTRSSRMQTSTGPDLQPGAKVGMRDYVRLALEQGLSPEQAVLMGAVGMAESTGQSGVRNRNLDTKDDSYGMWQINMLGDLGPDRLRRYGLRSAEDLKDPETNARVMASMLKTDGITAWGAYRDKRYLQYLGEARRIYSQLKSENFNQARGGRANFNPTNVQSIRIETPGASFQPGMDLWFADKQFGAVLPGTVKEIRPNNGRYGNMIVVESVDTKTGQPVDVVYAHLENINVREGQRINVGTVIGKQGGTGRVRSADGTIASVDFLAPAPRGSNSMTPYSRWQSLATEIKTRIESGRF